MTIMNEGEIIINDKTRAGEVAQIFVAAGIYDSVEKVPVYEDDGTTPEEAGISVHEVFGDIEPALQEVADKCKEAGIILNGQICYSGDYDGRYYITDNEVEDLTADEIGVREASNEELIAELQRRGLDVMVQESKPSESSKMEDLPALYAYDIKWDTDGDQEILDSIPKEIRFRMEWWTMRRFLITCQMKPDSVMQDLNSEFISVEKSCLVTQTGWMTIPSRCGSGKAYSRTTKETVT